MSLNTIPCTLEELKSVWAAVSVSIIPAVWTFRENRCLYIQHLDDIGLPNQHAVVGVVGSTETGARVMWVCPEGAWEFHVWLFDTADADHLEGGAAPAR